MKNYNNVILSKKTSVWFEEGYKLFAESGFEGLKVDVLARRVNKSRATFYHHFADLDVFIEILKEVHIERIKSFAQRVLLCKNVEPDLVNLMVELKLELLFTRHLRIKRANDDHKACFETTDKIMLAPFTYVWAKYMGQEINWTDKLMILFFESSFLQMTEENLNYEWLSKHFKELKTLISHLKTTK